MILLNFGPERNKFLQITAPPPPPLPHLRCPRRGCCRGRGMPSRSPSRPPECPGADARHVLVVCQVDPEGRERVGVGELAVGAQRPMAGRLDHRGVRVE